MGTLLNFATGLNVWVAEVAEAGEEAGFGLNLDPLQTNLINLAIIIGVLVYFGRGFLGKTLSERQARLEGAIKDAEERKRVASSQLAEAQQSLAQAQETAAQIRKEAEQRAESAKAAVLAQAEKDVERMKASAAQDLTSQRERVIRELRQRVVAMSIERVESTLRSDLGDDTRQSLTDRAIAMLGG